MSLELDDDKMCYGCGRLNEHGLKMVFEHPQKGLLRSAVTFGKEHQGFKDIVHGGMVALALDEMMVNLAWKDKIPAVTGELTVRLKKATPVGQKILLEASVDSEDSRLLHTSAVARNEQGEILARASAVCVKIKSDFIKIKTY